MLVRFIAAHQRQWLPFGQILASTTDVPFYYSGVTFPLFFRFANRPEEAPLPSIFCTGAARVFLHKQDVRVGISFPYICNSGRETLEWAVQEILRKSGQASEGAKDKIIQFR